MFPLPPREAVIYSELVRLLDARPVTEAGGAARTRTPDTAADVREELPASATRQTSLFSSDRERRAA